MLSMTAAAWLFRPLSEDGSWEDAIYGVLFTVLLINSAIRTRRRMQSSLGIHLEHVIHRNCAMAFFLAAGWAPWLWRIGGIWTGWMIAWLAVALVCMGLTVVELVRFHHASEARRRWWRVSRFQPTAGGCLSLVILSYSVVMGLSILLLAPDPGPKTWAKLIRPLETVDILYFVAGVALLLYIRSRQPPTAGAAA